MKKIKIIDLINMISKGEEVPKKLKYYNVTYTYNNKGDYYCEDSEEYYNDTLFFPQISNVESFLNAEVEILEEEKKIPEKLGINDINTLDLFTKVNEIIDYLKTKEMNKR